MKIIATMKDRSVITYHWQGDFAFICTRYIRELQKDLADNKVKHVTILYDNGKIYMKKGLRGITWDYLYDDENYEGRYTITIN